MHSRLRDRSSRTERSVASIESSAFQVGIRTETSGWPEESDHRVADRRSAVVASSQSRVGARAEPQSAGRRRLIGRWRSIRVRLGQRVGDRGREHVHVGLDGADARRDGVQRFDGLGAEGVGDGTSAGYSHLQGRVARMRREHERQQDIRPADEDRHRQAGTASRSPRWSSCGPAAVMAPGCRSRRRPSRDRSRHPPPPDVGPAARARRRSGDSSVGHRRGAALGPLRGRARNSRRSTAGSKAIDRGSASPDRKRPTPSETTWSRTSASLKMARNGNS